MTCIQSHCGYFSTDRQAERLYIGLQMTQSILSSKESLPRIFRKLETFVQGSNVFQIWRKDGDTDYKIKWTVIKRATAFNSANKFFMFYYNCRNFYRKIQKYTSVLVILYLQFCNGPMRYANHFVLSLGEIHEPHCTHSREKSAMGLLEMRNVKGRAGY